MSKSALSPNVKESFKKLQKVKHNGGHSVNRSEAEQFAAGGLCSPFLVPMLMHYKELATVFIASLHVLNGAPV